jgi:hypothetical protein
VSSAVEPYREGRYIWAPKRAEAADGTVGVGWVRLAPGDKGYAAWDRYLRGSGQQGKG